MRVTRRMLLHCLPLGALAIRAAEAGLRGKLVPGPALQTAKGPAIALTGDEETVAVLKDARLAGADLEVLGTSAGGKFAVGPIHTHSMFVRKDGKRLTISYWCDVCAIRTYSPGLCQCCREDTELQLREPAA